MIEENKAINKALDTKNDALALERMNNLLASDKNALNALNGSDASGWTPLFFAVQNGLENTVRFLLGEGADASVVDRYGDNILASTGSNHQAICNMIRAYMPKIEARSSSLLVKIDDGGVIQKVTNDAYLNISGKSYIIPTGFEDLSFQDTILHKALDTTNDTQALKRTTELLKICNPNSINVSGWTPLFCAAQNDLRDTMISLLRNGADATIIDHDDDNVTTYAYNATTAAIIFDYMDTQNRVFEFEEMKVSGSAEDHIGEGY